MKEEKTFKIRLWDFVDIEQINEQLDKLLRYKFVASDINYKCLEVSKSGELTLKATFEKMEV